MRIGVASDHAGYELKCKILDHLKARGHDAIDYGCGSSESCDYPDFIRPAACDLAAGKLDRAIVLGGSGNGEAIVSNRINGVRCALAWSEESARLGRRHNDANCLSMGARLVSPSMALELVDLFLTEEFEGGRHVARIQKIETPCSESESR